MSTDLSASPDLLPTEEVFEGSSVGLAHGSFGSQAAGKHHVDHSCEDDPVSLGKQIQSGNPATHRPSAEKAGGRGWGAGGGVSESIS